MTIRTFYDRVKGDYDGVVRRLGGEERVVRFLRMLLADDNLPLLHKALAEEDYATAFRAAHTIKGVALNLGLGELSETAGQLTELLRPQQPHPDIPAAVEAAERSYREAVEAVIELTGEA